MKLQHSINSRELFHSLQKSNLVILSVIASCAATSISCVDSDNEILLKVPLVGSCSIDGNGGVLPKEGSYDSSPTHTSFTVNLSPGAKHNVTCQVDNSNPKTPKTVCIDNDFVAINLALKNILASTTNYTSIGAGKEHRINQNDFFATSFVYEVESKKGSSVKISEKKANLKVPVGGTAYAQGVPFLDSKDLEQLRQLGEPSVEISVQVKGKLSSGYPIKSSKVIISVNFCTGANCQTTFLCNAPATK